MHRNTFANTGASVISISTLATVLWFMVSQCVKVHRAHWLALQSQLIGGRRHKLVKASEKRGDHLVLALGLIAFSKDSSQSWTSMGPSAFPMD